MLWRYSAGEDISLRAPAVGVDGTLYLETSSGQIHVLLPNGERKFAKAASLSYWAPTIGVDGTLYLPGYPKERMNAYDASLKELWSFQTSGCSDCHVTGPALQADGRVVIGGGFTVFSIRPNTTVAWLVDLTSPDGPIVTFPPVIASNGTIYVATFRALHAISPAGSLRWARLDIGQPVTSLAIDLNQSVYFGAGGTEYSFFCIGSDGKNRWRTGFGGRTFTGSPVIGIDGTVYIPVTDSGMHAIDATGKVKWVYPLPSRATQFTSAVLGDDGLIYFGDSVRMLYGMKSDGTLAWSRRGSGGTGRPVLAPDGTLYSAAGGNLFAIATSSKGMAKSPWPSEDHDLRNSRSAELPIAQRAFGESKSEDGRVTAVTIYEPGNGYDPKFPPAVVFRGLGRGASAHAIVEGGQVVAIEIEDPGSGYTLPPLVTIGSPPFVPGLSIRTETVRVEMHLTLGEKYQLETSMDLVNWAPVGGPFAPEQETFVRIFNVREIGQYFRALQTASH
ncbi:MAG: PQQ-binding-like beta-propeller repeat protein [Verrucomicrobia bacterium]|nr:PQQ-binding-like beta-propeller repeat protein [Verrucomicrobiota bacterium]